MANYGISAGTKEDYDSLKKKGQSSPSKPQWREEISPTQSVKKSRSVGKSAAAAKEPAQAAIEVQSVSALFPKTQSPRLASASLLIQLKTKDEICRSGNRVKGGHLA